MNEQVRPVTPRGFRDILFQEAEERRAATNAMLDAARTRGYRQVETPALERIETLAVGAGSAIEGDVFRLFDLDGGLLALRPEMTVPIARLVSSRLRDEPGPFRISYDADVYREHASLRGQYRQFRQVGVEYIGQEGPAADAECVTLAVEMLSSCGLRDFTVALGTVAVVNALLGGVDAPSAWRDAVVDALHSRNLVELDRLTGPDGAPSGLTDAERDALRGVPRIRGGREALDRCRELVAPCGCADTLDGLVRTWDVLSQSGVSERVAVDFGIVRAFDYYSGLVLEASAPGLGLPLGGGGRYDDLLARFGRPAPAAGFALTLERVHIVLSEQDEGGSR